MKASGASDKAYFERDGLHRRLLEDKVGFEQLAQFLKEQTGISLPLNEKNLALMAGRMARLLETHQIPGYGELHTRMVQGTASAMSLRQSFIAMLTTHTTHFFREKEHFDCLPGILDRILKAKVGKGRSQDPLRVWCAAASSGEEPYSMAMVLLEHLPSTTEIRFLASDIDPNILEKALAGEYPAEALEHVPESWRGKYFTTKSVNRGRGDERVFCIKREVQKIITFAPFNLISEVYPFQHQFDLVFCRNVLIYFEREDAEATILKIVNVMNDSGFLFVGHSESLVGLRTKLVSEGPAIYRKPGAILGRIA